jgi:hypothetical protein
MSSGGISADGGAPNSGEIHESKAGDRERFRDWEGLQKIKHDSAALLELL